jgi:hypothetical protein
LLINDTCAPEFITSKHVRLLNAFVGVLTTIFIHCRKIFAIESKSHHEEHEVHLSGVLFSSLVFCLAAWCFV